MASFTVLLDYRGGTHIRQLKAISAKRVLIASIPTFGLFKEKTRRQITKEVREDNPIENEGATNVWYSSALSRGQLVLFHVIKTSA
jgi:hypothetical protein